MLCCVLFSQVFLKSLALALYIGITFAIFNVSGKTPVCIDLLINILIGAARFSSIDF